DTETYRVTAEGRPLDLTYKEFELLRFLAQHPGRVYTRPGLLREVWGYDFYGGTRTVDVHVRRLRAKLGPEHEHLIQTVRGVGYRNPLAAATGRRPGRPWSRGQHTPGRESRSQALSSRSRCNRGCWSSPHGLSRPLASKAGLTEKPRDRRGRTQTAKAP